MLFGLALAVVGVTALIPAGAVGEHREQIVQVQLLKVFTFGPIVKAG